MSHLLESISWAFLITIGRYFIIAGIFFLVFYLLFPKSLLRNKIQSRLEGKADFLREMFYSSISSIMLVVTSIIALSDWLRPHTFIYTDLNAYPLRWIPISLLLTLIVYNTYFYWMHRILHHKRLFKVTHLVHHQSTSPNTSTFHNPHHQKFKGNYGLYVRVWTG